VIRRATAIAAWADDALDEDTRERIRVARAHAFDELARALDVEPAPETIAPLGLPTAAEARAMLASLGEELGLT
jgi:hypothetical protein